MTLDELPIGVYAIIKTVSGDQRLSEIFIKGIKIKVIAKASFGGPIAVKIYGTAFALKLFEAKLIEVNIL
jgi:Fe2+ transport system protein FeoA